MKPSTAVYCHPDLNSFEVAALPKDVRITNGGENVEFSAERLPWLIEVLQHIQAQHTAG